MTTTTPRYLLIALLSLVIGAVGCSSESDILAPTPDDKAETRQLIGDGATIREGNDIVDTAIAAGIFETLVTAVQMAELEDALRSEGPFTVFAPADEAFSKLDPEFVAQLLEPRNQEKLRELLLYHVVAGEIFAGDLRWFQFTETLQGQYLWIRKLWGTAVKVNNARVISADVAASNGVIHVIDTVLVPRGFELVPEETAPTGDIVETAAAAGTFETLLAAAEAAGLVDALQGDDLLTVFAPTDDAFAKLPQDLVAALLLPENQAALQELLLYHVVAGRVLAGDLDYYQRVATLQGGKVSLVKWFGNVWVNFSRVTTTDVLATNGVIHVIDRVLIPWGFRLETANGVHTAKSLEEQVSREYRTEMPPKEFQLEYLAPAR